MLGTGGCSQACLRPCNRASQHCIAQECLVDVSTTMYPLPEMGKLKHRWELQHTGAAARQGEYNH